ncbi:MAG TPA: hypothetical protein VEH83_01490 [Gemmatimonadales bacterium]|nr:hypothetical protein [Gemmatimonadales bacterium]
MKRQSLVLLAVAIVAAGAAGCFKDPVSSLRTGPTILSVDHAAVLVRTGDSTAVTATILDNGGNVLPETDATWTSADPTMAVVDKDTTVIPGSYLSRAFIRGVKTLGGWTSVIVTTRGLADTIRVAVIPAKIDPTLVTYAGPTLTDTVVYPASTLPPITPAKPVQYTAKDTLLLAGTSIMVFDTSKVTVQVTTAAGASTGLIVYKTPSQLKVIFEAGTAGQLLVRHWLLTPGNPAIGTIQVDTLFGDSVAVAPWRIGPAAFGASASAALGVVTVTAGTGMTFNAGTSAGFSGNTAIIIGQNATTLTLLSPVNDTGPVTLYNVPMTASGTGVASITFDSLQSNSAKFILPAAVLLPANYAFSPNNAKLGDTVTLTAPAGMSFSATSRVILGNPISTSDTAWVVSQTAGTMKVLPKRGGSGPITVTNLGLASPPPGPIPFPLATAGNVTIDSVNTDFTVGQTQGTAVALTIPANDTLITYLTALPGASHGGFAQSYTTFTTTAAHTIFASAAWFGSGNPYSTGVNTGTYTEDLDLLLCNAATPCDESGADLGGFAGATTSQPQSVNVAALPAAQYWINVAGFNVGYSIVYQLTVILQ